MRKDNKSASCRTNTKCNVYPDLTGETCYSHWQSYQLCIANDPADNVSSQVIPQSVPKYFGNEVYSVDCVCTKGVNATLDKCCGVARVDGRIFRKYPQDGTLYTCKQCNEFYSSVSGDIQCEATTEPDCSFQSSSAWSSRSGRAGFAYVLVLITICIGEVLVCAF